MNNADQPAYPVLLHEGEALPGGMEPNGLTKREEIASRLLASLFANPALVEHLADVADADRVVFFTDVAIDGASLLLSEIDQYLAEERSTG